MRNKYGKASVSVAPVQAVYVSLHGNNAHGTEVGHPDTRACDIEMARGEVDMIVAH